MFASKVGTYSSDWPESVIFIKFKNVYFSGLDYDYYKNYINTVRNIGPNEVQALANQYLNFNSFEKVIVGKK